MRGTYLAACTPAHYNESAHATRRSLCLHLHEKATHYGPLFVPKDRIQAIRTTTMQLIDTQTRQLVGLIRQTTPPYAILSHTHQTDEEVIYQSRYEQRKITWTEIGKACDQAQKHKLDHHGLY